MYKVVIIDDNIIYLKSIAVAIDWKKLNCIIVGTAENGLSGKRLIEKQKPDIILTDINMPGFDGLSMIRMVRNQLTHTKIIIITGYDKFEYAKRALHLHADEFLLKPVDMQHLYKILKTQISKLSRELRKIEEIKKLVEQIDQKAKQLNDSALIRKKHALYTIINMKNCSNQEQICQLTEANIPDNGYSIVIIKLNNLQNNETNKTVKEIMEVACRSLADNHYAEVLDMIVEHKLVLPIFFLKKSDNEAAMRKLHPLCLALDQLKALGKVSSYAISSDVRNPLSRFCVIYQEIDSNLEKIDYFRELKVEKIINGCSSLTQEYIDSKLYYIDEYIEKLICEKNIEKSKLYIEEIILYISQCHNENISEAKIAIIAFVVLLIKRLFNTISENKKLDIFTIAIEIQKFTDVYSISKYVNTIYYNYFYDTKNKKSQYSLLIQNFFKYIENSSFDNHSLNCVAKELAVSPSYLSSLIKKETGENYIDIVVKRKIKYAKKILLNTKYNIEEVSIMVGYQNYISFYKAFKRYEHISPKEYRESAVL